MPEKPKYSIFYSPTNFGVNAKIEPGPGAYDGTIYSDTLTAPSGIFRNAEVFFINGILNNFDDAKKTAQLISKILGTRVTLIYSMKEKGIIQDLVTAINISSGKEKTLATRMIEIKVRQNLENNKDVIVIAHSRGAALAKSAIGSLKVGQPKIKNLFIVTLGGFAEPAETWRTEATVLSFINWVGLYSDPVPRLLNPSISSLRSTTLLETSFEIAFLHVVESYFYCLKKFMQYYMLGFKGKKTIRDSPI